ncbi:hypothetical protein [Bacillus cereus]|uniref:hypothetical protein n=1 Tax=Bacillus cereus TaxID=1396 RepID=UPI00032D6F72|nr:hypothetical protein [Bacillus cereus]EOO44557.1 hypothetical protein ICK_06332 [Bacillus cereus BAG1X2-2]
MSNPNVYSVIKEAQDMPPELKGEIEAYKDSLKKIDELSLYEDPYIDNRLRSDKPITFLSFVDDLQKLWKEAGLSGEFIRYSPIKEDAVFPRITYRVVERKINQDIKDIKPRHRGTIRHPYRDGEYVNLYGQVFDVAVEFVVYSESAEEADEMILDLEEFIQNYTGFFKKNGVQEILFDSQGADEVIQNQRINIAKRPMYYKMRFEKITVKFTNEIRQVQVASTINNSL